MRPPRLSFLFVATLLVAAALPGAPGSAQTVDTDTTVAPAPTTPPTPAPTAPPTTPVDATLPVPTPSVTTPAVVAPVTPAAPVEPVTIPVAVPPVEQTPETAPPTTPLEPYQPAAGETLPPFLVDPNLTPVSIESTTTTTTTLDPSVTTTVADTLAPAPLDGDEVGVPELPPDVTVVLPPIAIQPPRNISLEGVMGQLVAEQQARIAAAKSRADQARVKVQAAQAELAALAERQIAAEAERTRVQSRFARVESDLRLRALDAYTGEELQLVDVLLNSKDVSTLQRSLETVAQIQQADRKLVQEFRSLRAGLESTAQDLELILKDRRSRLATIEAEGKVLQEELLQVQEGLAVLQQSDLIVQTGGFVFPVLGGASYIDSFGFPRMTGTKWSHPHQGADLFARYGTPLVAVQRGVVYKVGVAPLGGNRLWILTEGGAAYYYAHLSCFAPGIADGVVVEAGQVVGCLGTSGNAAGTPPHLHFEIHPSGYDGGALNPYPFLKAVEKADPQQLLAVLPPVTTTTVPITAPPGAVTSSTKVSFGDVVADIQAGTGSSIVPSNARVVADGSVASTVVQR